MYNELFENDNGKKREIYDLDLEITEKLADDVSEATQRTRTHCTNGCQSKDCTTAGATCLGTCRSCGVTCEGTCCC
jgi:hypothetical protein